jgi:putative oxidoreductase
MMGLVATLPSKLMRRLKVHVCVRSELVSSAPAQTVNSASSVQDRPMNTNTSIPLWQSVAILAGRLIFTGIFVMAASFKFLGMDATARYIASAGFPSPLLLAWVAAMFESVLSICFLTGAFFSEAALLAAAYVLFLAFAFHGPSLWTGNQSEFGFFVDHFTFIAGLLFAAVKGPGRILALSQTLIGRS